MPTANYLIANSLALKVNKFEHVQRGLEPCREGKTRDLYRVGIRAKALYGGELWLCTWGQDWGPVQAFR